MGMYQRYNGIDLKSLGLLWFPTEFHYVCQAKPDWKSQKRRHQWSDFKIMIHHDVSSWFGDFSYTCFSNVETFPQNHQSIHAFWTPQLPLPKKKPPMSISSSFGMMWRCDPPQHVRWTSRRAEDDRVTGHLFFLFIISRSSTSDMSTCETLRDRNGQPRTQQFLPQFALVLNFGFFFFWGWTRRCFFSTMKWKNTKS